MRPQDASLDMIDVELSPPEPFRFADDDEQPVEKKVGEEGEVATPEQQAETSEPTEKPLSRWDRRINQLMARTKEAEDRAAAAETLLELERERIREAQAASAVDDDERLIEEQIAAIDAQIASEADDPAMQTVLKANRLMLQREKSRAKVKQPEDRPQTQPQPPPQSAQVHPAASEWLQANDWYSATDEYDRPAYPTLASEATSLYHSLKSTYVSDSKELFEELNRRLSDLPEFERVLKKAAKPKVNGDSPAHERPSRQNTAPANVHADDRGTPEKGLPRESMLDKHDKAILRAMGKDPDDPKVRSTYIKYNPRKFKGAS